MTDVSTPVSSNPVSFSELEPPNPKALPDFNPPPRFGETTFEEYIPQHDTQSAGLKKVTAFVKNAKTRKPESGFRMPWQNAPRATGAGLYMDGGFGVGKTHLLAAAYGALNVPEENKLYLSFSELVHVIGVLGVKQAKTQLGSARLYCIDEFELDDPGNTLIVKTFLSHVFDQGGHVLTTSNTPPAAQGEGRFNAADFKREIQSIAERFEIVPIGGPDYRKREDEASLLSESEVLELSQTETFASGVKVKSGWEELFTFLESRHPIRYSAYLKQMNALYLHGARTIPDQNSALRFVHFIDKLYDLKVGLRLSGDDLETLFDASYRDGAYAKKHYRCLSRIAELLDEV